MHRIRRVAAPALGTALALVVMLAPASPAAAHDPIFLTDDQTTPDTGPFLPDGAISWAIYGTFQSAGETRGFEFDLREGDDLYVSLLIPNLEPELSIPDEELPYVELTLPDGDVRMLEAEIREIFDEQFSQTSYVTLFERKEPAVAGRHTIVVHSRGPARFTVAVGEREEFFTPAERTVDRPTSFIEIAEPLNVWYQTPPGADAPAPTDGGDGVEVDVEAMEEELDRLAEEEAAAGDEPADDAASDELVVESADADAGAEEVTAAPAAAGSDDDDDTDLAWVVPTAMVVVAIGGAGLWFVRRKAEA